MRYHFDCTVSIIVVLLRCRRRRRRCNQYSRHEIQTTKRKLAINIEILCSSPSLLPVQFRLWHGCRFFFPLPFLANDCRSPTPVRTAVMRSDIGARVTIPMRTDPSRREPDPPSIFSKISFVINDFLNKNKI